ncbi:hypothetical protein QZH41_018685, partial [Actinostola sp. cb2023]
KSMIPMVQLVLLVALLFLPINVTPYLAVWFYEKLLLLAEPILSIIEALQVVMFITYVSQSLVDEIEENPMFVKSTIIGIAVTSYSFVLWISYSLFIGEITCLLEKWILFLILVASIFVLIICLIQDEGSLGQAQVILRNLVSPTYLMLAAVRVGSVVCCLWVVRNFCHQ